MNGRCNCPRYHIPSADPNDSKGCPVHDPDYLDPQVELRVLRRVNEKFELVQDYLGNDSLSDREKILLIRATL